MDTKNSREAAKAIQKAEQLLKDIREANRHFLAETGKLGDRMEAQMEKAETIWKETEKNLKATEQEAGKEVEATMKDFFIGNSDESKEEA